MLLVNGKGKNRIQHQLSCEIVALSIWLEQSKLSLHLGKTESIIFGPKSKLSTVNKMEIKCNDVIIEAKTCIKYLGVSIDQTLNCYDMGNSVVKKVNSKLKFLYRKKKEFFGAK